MKKSKIIFCLVMLTVMVGGVFAPLNAIKESCEQKLSKCNQACFQLFQGAPGELDCREQCCEKYLACVE